LKIKKERLDNLLVAKKLADSREKARRWILAGAVRVNDRTADKPGMTVPIDSEIRVARSRDPFVSRGGAKLQEALDRFHIDCEGMTALDIGASTGGFTDCLLQHGAARVIAVDVGYGQLAWRLRQDPRVVPMERKNARYLSPGDIGDERVDLAVVDVSFISLKKIISPLRALIKSDTGEAIALIKPQFEAGRGRVGKGGIVRDPEILREVLNGLLQWFQDEDWGIGGLIPSPIRGQKGNREFLAHLKNPLAGSLYRGDPKSLVNALVEEGTPGIIAPSIAE